MKKLDSEKARLYLGKISASTRHQNPGQKAANETNSQQGMRQKR